MLNKLDDLGYIKKIDKNSVAKSIEMLYVQVRQVLGEARLIKVPREYSKVNKIVISGMGGSNLGGEILKSVFSDTIKAPIIINAGYGVPTFVDSDTLFIMSSYSGTTEETLGSYTEVKKRKAKVMAITAGENSLLAKLMLRDNIPGYIYKDTNNPCRVPRYGVGYSVFGMMVMLAKAGLFEIKVKDIENIIANLELWDQEMRPGIKTKMNYAKTIAQGIAGKQIVLIGAEFLQGSIHTFRNQICETGKNFGSYLMLPDLNHFAMEGLAFPKTNAKDLVFLFLDSKLYNPRIQKRSALTQSVIKKNKIRFMAYKMKGKSKLEQAFELLQLGSWITFYLAMQNGVNPAPNPWVDWFKRSLK